MATVSEEDRYALTHRLSCISGPMREGDPVRNADDLLMRLVDGSDGGGRYFAHPALLRRLFWWQDTSWETIQAWLDELVARGDVRVEPLGLNCYSGEPTEVVTIQDQRRFQRFAGRRHISRAIRHAVYERDGHRCRACGASDRLTLDHVHPWSRGGIDHPDNLQTLCGPCNSRKGARV